MKIVNRVTGKQNDNTYVTYTFDTRHEFRQWSSGGYYGYTPRGNFASVPTTMKMMRLVSEYEDRREQIPA